MLENDNVLKYTLLFYNVSRLITDVYIYYITLI